MLMDNRNDHLEAIVAMVDHVPTLMCRSRPDTTVIWTNRAYADFFGALPQGLIGERWIDHLPEEDHGRVLEALHSLTPDAPTFTVKRLTERHDGALRLVEWNETALFDERGNVVEIQTIAHDSSDDLKASVAVIAAANTDPLTGMSNRRALDEQIQTLAAKNPDAEHAVIVLDLDEFKAINDTYGHPIGDVVLQDLALRLERVTRSTDMVVRMGGDEFVILLTGLSTAEGIDRIATRITRLFDDPVTTDGLELFVTVSAGLATGRARDLSGSALQEADELMYEAKRSMRGALLARIDGRRYVWQSTGPSSQRMGKVVDLVAREQNARSEGPAFKNGRG